MIFAQPCHPSLTSPAARDIAIDRVTALENDPVPEDEDTPAVAYERAREFLSYIYGEVEGMGVPFVSPLPHGLHFMWKIKVAGTFDAVSVVVKDSGQIFLPDSGETVDMRDERFLADMRSREFVAD